MHDNEFIILAERTLTEIENALEADGLDCSVAGDGVLEIESADGEKIVVNRHTATQEIWVAARAGGFHFRWHKNAWKNTKDDRELMEVLRGVLRTVLRTAV